MKIVDCPECGGDIPTPKSKQDDLKCPKCGAQFVPKTYIHVNGYEYRNPVLYAKAHLRAAEKLLNSVA